MGFLKSIGWLMNLFGIIQFCLPVAFFAVNDWTRDFDCFGMVPLALDIFSSFLKALLYILISGLSPKTCGDFIEAVACNGMAGCITGGVLLSFFAYKKERGLLRGIMKMVSICLSVLFIFAVGVFLMGLQMKWNFKEEAPPSILMGAIIIAQVLQFLYPMCKRIMDHNFSSDESMVVALKCLASLILIFTSSYDAWSLGKSLHPLVTQQSAQWHLAMCLFGAATGVVQLIMRLYIAVTEVLLQMYHFWSTVFQKLKDKFTLFVGMPERDGTKVEPSGSSDFLEPLDFASEENIPCCKHSIPLHSPTKQPQKWDETVPSHLVFEPNTTLVNPGEP